MLLISLPNGLVEVGNTLNLYEKSFGEGNGLIFITVSTTSCAISTQFQIFLLLCKIELVIISVITDEPHTLKYYGCDLYFYNEYLYIY